MRVKRIVLFLFFYSDSTVSDDTVLQNAQEPKKERVDEKSAETPVRRNSGRLAKKDRVDFKKFFK